MVRAILEGRKTQTRRILKPQPASHHWETMPGYELRVSGPHPIQGGRVGVRFSHRIPHNQNDDGVVWSVCPHGSPGDRLWVRESGWERPERTPRMMREGADTWEPYYFDADALTDADIDDFKRWGFKRRPSILMPRRASRITLEILDVRVERLNDITNEDCFAEGLPSDSEHGNRTWYSHLWESIHGPGSWDLNPWVWVIEFPRFAQGARP